MTAPSANPRDVDKLTVTDELRRLIDSPGLQHAESLSQLLRYLVEQSLQKPHEHVKEYQIAVEVFGRPESFDPRLDSTVRVQTSRLRNKLIEYYATTGVNDPLVIEIPKGTYHAVFHPRPLPPAVEPASASTAEKTGRKLPPRYLWLSATVAALLVGFLAGVVVFHTVQPPAPRQVRAFWTGLLKSKQPALVIFSNAEFKGRPESGLRYFDAGTDSPDHINDLYTGVGEVMAIDELSRVVRLLNREILVKRSGLLSWDETRERDLIFAGSPTENLSLRDLKASSDFVFRAMKPGEPRPGDLAIVNLQPRPGEARLYFASPGLPITEDYAAVTLQPGLHPGQSVLLLAGTTTLGTQAAAEFVTQNDHLEELRKRLNIAPDSAYPPFSAVVHVRVARGVPVESSIAAVHAAR